MSSVHPDSFGSKDHLTVGSRRYTIYRIDAVEHDNPGAVARLPYTVRILLENLLRFEDGRIVTREDITALANWSPETARSREIAYRPARVLLQDFTGVPAVVDLAAMRDAIVEMGGDAAQRSTRCSRSNSSSIIPSRIDYFGTRDAFSRNAELGIRTERRAVCISQMGTARAQRVSASCRPTRASCIRSISNILRASFSASEGADAPRRARAPEAYPDTVVGTDSHTTMADGLGVLAWGVGGIEAEARDARPSDHHAHSRSCRCARTNGRLAEGITATDLVLDRDRSVCASAASSASSWNSSARASPR